MSQTQANFEMISKSRNLEKLLDELEELFKLTSSQLATLRQRQSASTTVDPEVRKVRDELDCVLRALALIEVGSIAHAIPDKLPPKFRSRVLSLLEHSDVQAYYKVVRPLLLIESLAKRLRGDAQLAEKKNQRCLVVFMSFAHLQEALRDKGVSEFAELLAGRFVGKREYEIGDLFATLRNLESVWGRLSRPATEADALDRSVQGMQRFFAFADAFHSLLYESKGLPLLQSSMWHYHSFWFQEHAQSVTDVVDVFCERIMMPAAEQAEESEDALEQVHHMKAIFAELTNQDRFGPALRAALQRRT